jgi:hypothetical protein
VNEQAAKVKAKQMLDRASAELDVASRSGRDDRVSKLTRSVEEARMTANRAAYVEEVFTKALLFSEVDRLSEEKATLLRDIFSQYSASGSRLSQRVAACFVSEVVRSVALSCCGSATGSGSLDDNGHPDGLRCQCARGSIVVWQHMNSRVICLNVLLQKAAMRAKRSMEAYAVRYA